MALNAALASAGQSLEVFSAGVQVAGQNVANASTPGYIREELHLETSPAYRSGSLILGTGVTASGVKQQIDQYLEVRIHNANSELATASIKDQIYKQLEGEIQELGDHDLSTALSSFLNAVQDLAAQPESVPFRDLVIRQGTDLARDIRSLNGRVDELRQSKTVQVENVVKEANTLIDQIQHLNGRIIKLELGGLAKSDAGAARSERYQALNRLSELVPIRYREQDNGAVDVFSDSDYLVLSGSTQKLEIVTTGTNVEDFRIELSKTRHNISGAGGELRGLIEGRDEILGGFLTQLNELSSNLIHEFNQLHASGTGLQGFDGIRSTNSVTDSNAALNQSGLPFDVQHGSFQIQVINKQTGIKQTQTISVDVDNPGTNTTLEDIRAALDTIDNVSAVINPKGELEIQAASGFEFQFANDTSGFLSAAGVNTFFTGVDAGTINISNVLTANSDFLATGHGGGPSDGRNITGLLELLDQPLESLGNESLSGFYEQVIAQVAQDSATEQDLTAGFSTFRDSLVSQQQQFTGVSLDEEAIRILEFQHAYQAAARIISTVNELFSVLVNL